MCDEMLVADEEEVVGKKTQKTQKMAAHDLGQPTLSMSKKVYCFLVTAITRT